MKRFIFFIVMLLLGLSAWANPVSWSPGTVAKGTAEALKPISPLKVALPRWLVKRIKKETVVFYFSPTCPHCQTVMPEIQRIYNEGIPVLGVASGTSSSHMVEAFQKNYNVST